MSYYINYLQISLLQVIILASTRETRRLYVEIEITLDNFHFIWTFKTYFFSTGYIVASKTDSYLEKRADYWVRDLMWPILRRNNFTIDLKLLMILFKGKHSVKTSIISRNLRKKNSWKLALSCENWKLLKNKHYLVKIEKENSIKTSIISWNKIGTLKHMS